MRKSGLGFVCSLGCLPGTHEDIGHGEHGGDGDDLVGAPVEAPVSKTLSLPLLTYYPFAEHVLLWQDRPITVPNDSPFLLRNPTPVQEHTHNALTPSRSGQDSYTSNVETPPLPFGEAVPF